MKYLVELKSDDYHHNNYYKRFYYDNLKELQVWLNKEIDNKTLFNCGFDNMEVHLYRIDKGRN